MNLKSALVPVVVGTLFVGTGLASCSQLGMNHSADSASGGEQVVAGQSDGTMSEGHTSMSADHIMMMDLGPADESVDLRFIDAMILHHQGAVVMAQEALEKSERPEIRELAEAIISAQETEIRQMQEWRVAWYPDAGTDPVMFHAEMNHNMAMSEDMKAAMMMSGDLGPADAEFDRRFLEAMIPHHEGALVMAEEILQKSDRPEVQELAEAILSSQADEITQMRQWLQDWYGQ